jgi:[NiFe] hydrogenase large subunit/hydrogenase large subunit
MAVAHYLEALDFQRDIIRMQALLGAKNPHPQTWLVGGMAIPVDPNSQNALNAGSIAFMHEIAKKSLTFVEKVYIPDLLAVASFYKEWAGIGGGVGNYLSYGEFQNDNVSNTTNTWLPGGFIRNKNLGKVEPVDQAKVTEDAAHAWYHYSDGDNKAKHPWEGETNAQYTGPKPPYKFLDTDKKYSWVKGIRYDGLSTEVGPLSRMLVAYASGHKRVKEVVEMVLKNLGVGPTALFSTLGRTAARGIETLVTAEMIPVWIDELAAKMKSGDLRIHDATKWDPSSWPKEAKGFGFHEAPRGALGHWVVIKDGKVANYQCVVPGGWNSSPRDSKGQRGPFEEALVGTPLRDPEKPLEILRTIHSFDPCMACAIHVVDPGRNEIIKVRVT